MFEDAMRRVVTGDDAEGKSIIIVDGGPANPNPDTLFEIWHDLASGALDAQKTDDLGEKKPMLSPASGKVKVRWFVVSPLPEGAPRDQVNAAVRERFIAFGAGDHLRDQNRHPAMHQTETLDVICLIQGEASLVLDKVETRLKPGNIVIQRGTSHGWTAHGGPALFLAVLIDRPLAK